MVLRVHTPRDKIAVDEKVVDVRALGDERSAEKAGEKAEKRLPNNFKRSFRLGSDASGS